MENDFEDSNNTKDKTIKENNYKNEKSEKFRYIKQLKLLYEYLNI